MSASAVAARVQERLLDASGEMMTIDAQRVAAVARREAPLLDGPSLERLVDDVVAEVNGLGPVWIERGGAVRPAGLSLDQCDIERIVERVVAPLGLRADRTAPIVD